jgi:hypothetical protein
MRKCLTALYKVNLLVGTVTAKQAAAVQDKALALVHIRGKTHLHTD